MKNQLQNSSVWGWSIFVPASVLGFIAAIGQSLFGENYLHISFLVFCTAAVTLFFVRLTTSPGSPEACDGVLEKGKKVQVLYYDAHNRFALIKVVDEDEKTDTRFLKLNKKQEPIDVGECVVSDDHFLIPVKEAVKETEATSET